MATIVLSAAGMALGGSIGGTVLGLSTAVIGRAVGATLGQMIDQRILGSGSEPVDVGRVDRFRLTGASEGAAVPQVFGRMRVAGQVIWATRFVETSETTGGGKGAGPTPETTEYSYSVSLAIALCEGPIRRVGRVWADGVEIARDDLNMRIYRGTAGQQPDPKIVAVEGADAAPAYRGTAYVVCEDLPLGQFGNRVPQLTFEVMRPAHQGAPEEKADLAHLIEAVAMIPGTGEYALGTTPAYLSPDYAEYDAINTNTPSGHTDFETSVTALTEELSQIGSVSLVVSWFGSDLRCNHCKVEPKVDQLETDAEDLPWVVCGQTRTSADRVPLKDGRPVYGGTPSDGSVIEALRHLSAKGLKAVFYPFILMEQMPGNGLPDPWTGEPDQPKLPWRGRITTSKAPGQPGSPDGTAAAVDQVADFMGTAQVSDFSLDGDAVVYSGPAEWSYRRFILHYAHLCKAAGGVDAFCIGSEMRALTQIRGPGNSFPAVAALVELLEDVRAVLGPGVKLSYAADWSEYHGYQPVGTGDKFFHLDPLWAHPETDFVGIDNYMPLSDWRDGRTHLDAGFGSIYNLDYLSGNVAGGEGFDWFYHSPEARAAQIRTPITDGDGEPWVWRYKDLRGWWANDHHDRVGGQRVSQKTAWVPKSKPFWFTELGCAAIDKGTNQPNKFLDPKSSESLLPHYSNGMRDDFMQMQYLRAVDRHFAQAQNNPWSGDLYQGRMVNMSRAHVWAWDARPFPVFPGNAALWSDGDNYARGHWLNGRVSSRTLASVVAEICERSGVTRYDVSRLYGVVRGYTIDRVSSGRAALQPLMLAYGVEAAEREGKLVFTNRDGHAIAEIGPDDIAYDAEKESDVIHVRASDVEIAGRVQVGYVDGEADYEAAVAETVHPEDRTFAVSRSEFPLALTASEAARIAARWTQEARVSKDTATFALPPSQQALGPGDVIALAEDGAQGTYRIDRIEEAGVRLVEATRTDEELYLPQERLEEGARLRPFVAPTPVEVLFMDLPLLTGDEVPHEPHVAASARPWPGGVALYSATRDAGYVLQDVFRSRSVVGRSETRLDAGRTGLWDRQAGFRVRLVSGALSSMDPEDVFAGGNLLAIGDGSAGRWEVLQFAQAQLVAPRTYELSDLLRGQAGTSFLTGSPWPKGSDVVLLDGRPEQITIPSASRGNPRHYRWGPVKRPVSDRSYRHRVLTFEGNGYRPYPVVHLRAQPNGSDVAVSWIRQTRIDGDLWGRTEVPLGEEAESYVVQVRQGLTVLREVTRGQPGWTYTAAQQAADGVSGDFTVSVAQVSARFGPGPFTDVAIGG